MEDILKGNYEVKEPVKVNKIDVNEQDPVNVREALKKRALASLGGSMVYVERDMLMWDGE